MSVNAYNSQTGTTTVLANGQRLWMGTKAAHDAAQQAGTLPNNALIAVTDDFPTDCSDAYSTDETKTYSTWIDGKPIYRKVVNIGALPDNAMKNVAHNITNLDTITDYYGIVCSTSKTALKIPYEPTETSDGIAMYVSITNVAVRTKQNMSGYSGYAVVEYTKTTDT